MERGRAVIARRTATWWISRGLYLAILTGGALLMFVPFAWSLSTSLKGLGQAMTYPPVWWPHPFQASNYVKIWHIVPIGQWFINSVLVASAVTAANLIFDSLGGYALARVRFPGKKFWYMGIVAMLMIPFQAVMLPLYIVMKDLGLLDNYGGLIAPVAVSAMGIFLMRQAFLALPSELEDAARIDGAGRFRMFWQLSLPLVTPTLLTLALMIFLSSWNNFLLPLLVANRASLWTLPLGIVMFQQEYFVNWPYLMAAAVLATLPIALVFLVFQRWFIRGVATTGLK